MSVAYGYDLKDGDRILETQDQVAEILSPLLLPGAALVNHLPFRTVSDFIHVDWPCLSCFQCGTFLRGSHTSATNHWHE